MEGTHLKLSAKAAALLAFAVPLCLYLASGSVGLVSGDTAPNSYVPVSLLLDGDPVFSPLEAPLLFVWKEKHGAEQVPVDVQSWTQRGFAGTFADEYRRGQLSLYAPRYYLVPTLRTLGSGEPLFASAFGPAPGLAALPATAIAAALGANLNDAFVVFRIAKATAALLIAASAGMVFFAALVFLSRERALLLAGLYALGTCVWTTSSQDLWQQTPEIFFLSLGVLCLLRGKGVATRGALAGLAMFAAATCRPTAAVVTLAAAAFLVRADRRSLIAYVAAGVPIVAALVLYNLYYFGAPLEFGQLAVGEMVAQWKTGSTDLWQTPIWLGAAGLMLSPSRGLLVYTPFFAAGFVGTVLAWRNERYITLRFLSIAVALLWLPAFAWFDWWGGWTYGYRPIVDTAPLLAMLCIPALEAMRRPAAKAAFAVAAGWSVLIQVLGVVAYTPAAWNAQRADGTPANIDLPEHRDRLWSLRDSQIAYLLAQIGTSRQR